MRRDRTQHIRFPQTLEIHEKTGTGPCLLGILAIVSAFSKIVVSLITPPEFPPIAPGLPRVKVWF